MDPEQSGSTEAIASIHRGGFPVPLPSSPASPKDLLTWPEMVVATRASVRRRESCTSSAKSSEKNINARSASDDPQIAQPKKRSRRSFPTHTLKPRTDGTSDAQHDNVLATNSISGTAELTWQQRELLNQSRVKARRSTRTAATTRTSISSLPVLRVTNDLEIVTTSEPPKQAKRTRRSLPSPSSLPHPQSHWSATSKTLGKRRVSAAAPPSQAYAEPSCFRAPLPQSLPLPCFPKSIKSAAIAATLT